MRAMVLAGALALAGGCDEPQEPFLGDEDYVRDPALDVAMISARGGSASHEVGQNCMNCHQPHGPGPGLFTAAGTLHDADGEPYPDGALELRTAANGGGELVLRVEADGLGNFYTTEKLPLPDMPVFPTVYSADGERSNFMPFPTASAACNVCHVGSAVIRFKE